MGSRGTVVAACLALATSGCSLLLDGANQRDDAGPEAADADVTPETDAGVEVENGCGKASNLSTSFASHDPVLWITGTPANVMFDDGLTLRLDQTTPQASYIGVLAYDLTDSRFVFDISEFPDQGQLQLQFPTINAAGEISRLELAFSPNLVIVYEVSGLSSKMLSSQTRATLPNGAFARFWQLRNQGDTYFVEYSDDSLSFERLAEFPVELDMTRTHVSIALSNETGPVAPSATIAGINLEAGPPTYCPFTDIVDDFAAPRLAAHWSRDIRNDCTVTSGGELTLSAEGTVCSVVSAAGYSFASGHVSVKVLLQDPANVIEFRIVHGLGTKEIKFSLTGQMLSGQFLPDGANAMILLATAPPFVYLRALIDDDKVRLQYSLDGSEWLQVATDNIGRVPTAPARLQLDASNAGNGAFAVFDDLNVL